MNTFRIPEGYEDSDFCCPHCGFIENTPPSDASHLRTGTVLNGRYIIGTVLGSGGFGVTYKAWDEALETVVAVKEFFPKGIVSRKDSSEVTHFESDEYESFEHGRARFLKEARNLVKFNSNPGTVSIYDCFEANGTAYIVMEYLYGRSMKEIVYVDGIPDIETINNLFIDICSVLIDIHSAGLIHGDISPDNILRISGVGFKLIDFGAMKNFYKRESFSSTKVLKRGYAPIEQFATDGSIGPWTDIYSFGASLYEITTGVMAQDAEERVYFDRVKAPIDINPSVGRELSDGIMRAMALKAEDRFQSVEEFRRDVLRY